MAFVELHHHMTQTFFFLTLYPHHWVYVSGEHHLHLSISSYVWQYHAMNLQRTIACITLCKTVWWWTFVKIAKNSNLLVQQKSAKLEICIRQNHVNQQIYKIQIMANMPSTLINGLTGMHKNQCMNTIV